MKKDAAPEFSRPLPVDKITAGGTEERLIASAEERRLLTERFGLLDLQKLEARFDIHPPHADRTVTVTGTLVADVTQQCVVTLEPMHAHIEEDIDVLFTPDDAESDDLQDEELEPIVNGVLDLGELAAQHMGAALDPYPRKPGLAYVELEYGGEGAAPGPLAKLVELKKPKDQT